jgi:pyruvate carboxylase
MAFGDIVKVTPSSKVVGDMTLFLVSHGMTMREFERLSEDHNLHIPNSVVEMFAGALGEPEGGWPEHLQRIILRGAKPQIGRPGEYLPPADFDAVRAAAEKRVGHKVSRTDLMSYLMYPEVFVKFAKVQAAYGDLDVLPTPEFFYGMQRGDQIAVDLEPGKTLMIRFQTVGDAHADGYRSVYFELNGQPREVSIRDKSVEAKVEVKAKADTAKPGHVGAPIPGAVTSIAVELNQHVEKGDRLLVMEAMKMQTTVYAPVSGRIAERLVQVGEKVEPKDLLLVIE